MRRCVGYTAHASGNGLTGVYACSTLSLCRSESASHSKASCSAGGGDRSLSSSASDCMDWWVLFFAY